MKKIIPIALIVVFALIFCFDRTSKPFEEISSKGYKKEKSNIKIAILDSGVDYANDIKLEETISLVPGEEEMSPLFMDGTGHGNSVAGLIGAEDNGEGITGINPDALIYSVRVLDDDNKAPLSRIIEGIYYIVLIQMQTSQIQVRKEKRFRL